MLPHPSQRQPSHFFQCAWLGEEVGCAGDDCQPLLALERVEGGPVELQDGFVGPAHNQQRGSPHSSQHWCGEVGAAAPGHNGAYCSRALCRRDEGGGRAGAGTEKPDW